MDTAPPSRFLFEGTGKPEGKDFDGRYSQRGVEWAEKTVARRIYATHLLEDAVNIITVQKLLGHGSIENTMV